MTVITTPTGAIGHQVLEHVVRSKEPIRVIARDPSRLPTQVRERIDVVQGSHGDATIVNRAFAGADAVFWLVPPDPRAKTVDAAYVDFTRPACAAFKAQGVKRVVGISALGRGTPAAAHAGLVTASLKMDDIIASAGVHYRAVTNPSFMDNLLRQVELIKAKGIFSLPIAGDLKQPSASTRDIAATAATVLLDQSWSGVGSEAYRVCRRAHSLRGWSLWHDRHDTLPRFENGQSGWSESTGRSIRRSGRRSRRSPRSWDARARRFGAGSARRSVTLA